MVAMKPFLEVQVPILVSPHTPKVLTLLPNEVNDGISLISMVIRQLEDKYGSHTWV